LIKTEPTVELYILRAETLIRLAKYEEALEDALKAIA